MRFRDSILIAITLAALSAIWLARGDGIQNPGFVSKTTTGYSSGRFYDMMNGNAVGTNVFPTSAINLYIYPFAVVDYSLSATSLNTRVITGQAGCTIKMAVWAHSTVTFRPVGIPIAGSNADVVCSGSGSNQAVPISYTFNPGVYWAGFASTATGITSSFFGCNPTTLPGGVGSIYGVIGKSSLSNTGTCGFSTPFPYANNIMALDLTTPPVYTDVAAGGVPTLFIGN